MASKSDDVMPGLVGLIGSLVFIVLTVFIPLVTVLGGFLTYSTTLGEPLGIWRWDLYWDVVQWGPTGLFNQESYSNYIARKAVNDLMSVRFVSIFGEWIEWLEINLYYLFIFEEMILKDIGKLESFPDPH